MKHLLITLVTEFFLVSSLGFSPVLAGPATSSKTLGEARQSHWRPTTLRPRMSIEDATNLQTALDGGKKMPRAARRLTDEEAKIAYLYTTFDSLHSNMDRVTTLLQRMKEKEIPEDEKEATELELIRLLERLRSLSREFPETLPPETDFKTLQETNRRLKRETQALYREIVKAYGEKADERLTELNTAITPKLWLRAWVEAELAYRFLTEKKNPSAALALLLGTRNRMANLQIEYYWRRVRPYIDQKVTQLTVTDFFGFPVEITYVGEYDIRQSPKGEVTIVQRIWKKRLVLVGEKMVTVKVPEATPIKFQDMPSAFRSRIHTLFSEEKDYGGILHAQSNLRHIILRIEQERQKRGPLPQKELLTALEITHKWIRRGIADDLRRRALPDFEEAKTYLEKELYDNTLSALQRAKQELGKALDTLNRRREGKRKQALLLLNEWRNYEDNKQKLFGGIGNTITLLDAGKPLEAITELLTLRSHVFRGRPHLKELRDVYDRFEPTLKLLRNASGLSAKKEKTLQEESDIFSLSQSAKKNLTLMLADLGAKEDVAASARDGTLRQTHGDVPSERSESRDGADRQMAQGILVGVIGPSGSGRHTLFEKFEREFPGVVERVVQVTTRASRPGETNGVDYYFVSDEAFDQKVRVDELVRVESIYGARYGIPRTQLEEKLAKGKILLQSMTDKNSELEEMLGDRLVYVYLSPVPKYQLKEKEAIKEELRYRHAQRGLMEDPHIKERLNKVGMLGEIQKNDPVVYNLRGDQKKAYEQFKSALSKRIPNFPPASPNIARDGAFRQTQGEADHQQTAKDGGFWKVLSFEKIVERVKTDPSVATPRHLRKVLKGLHKAMKKGDVLKQEKALQAIPHFQVNPPSFSEESLEWVLRNYLLRRYFPKTLLELLGYFKVNPKSFSERNLGLVMEDQWRLPKSFFWPQHLPDPDVWLNVIDHFKVNPPSFSEENLWWALRDLWWVLKGTEWWGPDLWGLDMWEPDGMVLKTQRALTVPHITRHLLDVDARLKAVAAFAVNPSSLSERNLRWAKGLRLGFFDPSSVGNLQYLLQRLDHALSTNLFSKLLLGDLLPGDQEYVKAYIYRGLKEGRGPNTMKEELETAVLPSLRILGALLREGNPTFGVSVHQLSDTKEKEEALQRSGEILRDLARVQAPPRVTETDFVGEGREKHLETRVLPSHIVGLKMLLDELIRLQLIQPNPYTFTVGEFLDEASAGILASTFFFPTGRPGKSPLDPSVLDQPGAPPIWVHTEDMMYPKKTRQTNIYAGVLGETYDEQLWRLGILSMGASKYFKGFFNAPESAPVMTYKAFYNAMEAFYKDALELDSETAELLLGEGMQYKHDVAVEHEIAEYLARYGMDHHVPEDIKVNEAKFHGALQALQAKLREGDNHQRYLNLVRSHVEALEKALFPNPFVLDLVKTAHFGNLERMLAKVTEEAENGQGPNQALAQTLLRESYASARDGADRQAASEISEFQQALEEFGGLLSKWEANPADIQQHVEEWNAWLEIQKERFIRWGKGKVMPNSKEALALQPLMEKFLEWTERAKTLFESHLIDTRNTAGLATIQVGNFYHFLLGNTDRAVQLYAQAPEDLRQQYFRNDLFGGIRRAFEAHRGKTTPRDKASDDRQRTALDGGQRIATMPQFHPVRAHPTLQEIRPAEILLRNP